MVGVEEEEEKEEEDNMDDRHRNEVHCFSFWSDLSRQFFTELNTFTCTYKEIAMIMTNSGNKWTLTVEAPAGRD